MAKTIQDYQNEYADAQRRGDTMGMQAAHAGAEAIRQGSGFSGGIDGSQNIPLIPATATTNQNALIPSPNVTNYDIPTYNPEPIKEFVYKQPSYNLPGQSDTTWVAGLPLIQNDLDKQNAANDELFKQYQSKLASQQEAQRQRENYYTSSGLIAPMNPNDYSGEIRQLGDKWNAATDQALKDQYHQQALQYGKMMGILPSANYSGSVNGLAGLTSAGTPTAEVLAAIQKAEWDADPNNPDNVYKQAQIAKLESSGGSSGGGSGGSSSGGKITESEKTRQANQAAIDWIGKYQSSFTGKYPAKNMYEQVKRNMVAGTIDATLGAAILRQLKENFME